MNRLKTICRQYLQDSLIGWMWFFRREESSMTMTTYDPSYWVNDGASNSDRQEWRNRFRGESQEFVLSTLIL